MKILFTLLVIETEQSGIDYMTSALKTIRSILSNDACDVKITTNMLEAFNDIAVANPKRIIIDYHNMEDKVLYYPHRHEFNFNLKHMVFNNIDAKYDIIFYIDADNNIVVDDIVVKYLKEFIVSDYDVICARANARIGDEYNNPNTIYEHKFKLYSEMGINWDNYCNAIVPSEHFLIFKNTPKVERFGKVWESLNTHMQNRNNPYGAWGDGVEIGMSLLDSDMHNIKDENAWVSLLNISFNGNKLDREYNVN